MSALSQAMAAFAGSYPPLASEHVAHDTKPSPDSTSSALPSLSSSASTSSSDLVSLCTPPPPPQPIITLLTARPNEHLAVLLPEYLWKADSLASTCDNFYCRIRFSFLVRRHHCRKCGGIFCASCTTRSSLLLDTSKLEFLHPPRNVPLSHYESPESPILNSRVCDDCWEQIEGTSVARTPDLIRSTSSSPISLESGSGFSSLASSYTDVATLSNCLPPSMSRRSTLRQTPSLTSLNSNPHSNTPSRRVRVRRTSHLETAAEIEAVLAGERSYGELDAYPLKRHSSLCKATGGGRWEPKPVAVHPGYRIPGCKAPFEEEMEREEAEEKQRRANPIVQDGEFRYRFPKEAELPAPIARSFQLSTF